MSHNQTLQQILINKWDNRTLSHFYIFRTRPSETARSLLNDMTKEFLSTVLAKEKNITVESSYNIINGGHPDILYIDENERAKNYTLNDEAITDFLKFHTYGNFEMKHRFAIINDATFLSEVILNKFLKTLEEPSKNTTIIFLEPTGVRLLPTIESRAITFNFIGKEDSNSAKGESFYNYLRSKQDFTEIEKEHLHYESKFYEYTKGNKILERKFFEHAITWAISNTDNFTILNDIQKIMQWTERSLTFHNSESQRITAILNILHKIAV